MTDKDSPVADSYESGGKYLLAKLASSFRFWEELFLPKKYESGFK
jgi:hypothetical protein